MSTIEDRKERVRQAILDLELALLDKCETHGLKAEIRRLEKAIDARDDYIRRLESDKFKR